MKRIFFLFTIVTGLFACSPKNAEVVENVEETTTTDTSEMPKAPIGEGKVVFIKKCGRCHELPKVEEHTREQWANILPRMIKKANLDEQEGGFVSAYIDWEIDND